MNSRRLLFHLFAALTVFCLVIGTISFGLGLSHWGYISRQYTRSHVYQSQDLWQFGVTLGIGIVLILAGIGFRFARNRFK